MSRYAENTNVPVAQSRGEITGILAKNGVERMGWFTEPSGDVLQFELAGHSYRFRIVRPTQAEIFEMYPNHRDTAAKVDQEWRRRWRANVLLLKAKLEFADGEPGAVIRELMPYALLGDGTTTLEEAIAGGQVPLLSTGR